MTKAKNGIRKSELNREMLADVKTYESVDFTGVPYEAENTFKPKVGNPLKRTELLREVIEHSRKPVILNEEQLQLIEKEAGYLNLRQMAGLLGINRDTFRLLLRDDPRLSEAIERGKAKKVSKVAKALNGAILDGDVTAMKFFLERIGEWKESKHVALEEVEREKAPLQNLDDWYTDDFIEDPKLEC